MATKKTTTKRKKPVTELEELFSPRDDWKPDKPLEKELVMSKYEDRAFLSNWDEWIAQTWLVTLVKFVRILTTCLVSFKYLMAILPR